MLQVSTISKNLEKITKSMLKRNIDINSILEKIIETDNNRRSTQSSLDNSLASSNQLAKEIGEFFKSGETKKAGILKEKAGFLKKESKNFSEKLSNIIKELNNLLLEVPNIPHELVPSGSNESDNKEIFKWGSIPELKESALPHWDLASKYDIIDFELGNKITGAGFPVYKDKGAKLQRALINYFLDKNTKAQVREEY